METQKSQQGKQSSPAVTTSPTTSCRKKKNEEATFLVDLKDHIDEFIHASMDDHKTCFKKTMQKMFGMSKVFAERSSESAKEVESSLPLQTTVSK
ncbi:Dipeptide transport ATP-binding protein dppF [Quillaja saponaria]|uniref:Dipeptide transport ATP-binding protein dppF n=1 Tax=Quillaja saponaria TaxID=32244 RepID=A0AAD7PTW6_QUISA|nr:Dipeptide transport ATP-binding protein dppF [Quillaja saponaria]KAJ7967318.1 Dipeptide transport ATP-binding protein dppF [Quillaja saponaria]